MGDPTEEQVRGVRLERQVAAFVDDQQLRLGEMQQLLLQPSLGASPHQLLPTLGGPGSNSPSPLAAQRDVTSSRIGLESTEGCASYSMNASLVLARDLGRAQHHRHLAQVDLRAAGLIQRSVEPVAGNRELQPPEHRLELGGHFQRLVVRGSQLMPTNCAQTTPTRWLRSMTLVRQWLDQVDGAGPSTCSPTITGSRSPVSLSAKALTSSVCTPCAQARSSASAASCIS